MSDTRDSIRHRLANALVKLEGDELRVMLLQAERLLEGREAYGKLVLEGDGRDWGQEILEEAADLLQYWMMLRLSR